MRRENERKERRIGFEDAGELGHSMGVASRTALSGTRQVGIGKRINNYQRKALVKRY